MNVAAVAAAVRGYKNDIAVSLALPQDAAEYSFLGQRLDRMVQTTMLQDSFLQAGRKKWLLLKHILLQSESPHAAILHCSLPFVTASSDLEVG